MILRPPLALVLLGIVLPVIIGCGSARFPRETLSAQYAEAARDAEYAEPEEVVTDLPASDTWVRDDRGRVRVTVWTRKPPAVGWSGPAAEELWVTPAPYLEDFCRRLFRAPKSEVRLRLEQLLGLPPGAGEGRRVVELWVPPDDLFRPCPDRQSDDRSCDVHAPVGDDHRRWFEQRERIGRAPDGALWTRLGVTYDWGDPYSEAGLPVVVVPAGTPVEVTRVEPTHLYCGTR